MEKDYFKDRSGESKLYSKINIGDTVYVCEKYMQKHAKTLEHLTFGTVTRKLSKHNHPRGIKVEILMDILDLKVVGRVVYLVKDGIIIKDKNLL